MAVTLDDDSGNSNSYFFNGPFRGVGVDSWEIGTKSSGTSSAMFSPPVLGSSLYDQYPSGLLNLMVTVHLLLILKRGLTPSYFPDVV